MAIRVDAKELYEVLRLTPPEQNIMLIGKHGIGKSEIITQFYRQHSMPVIAFFLGQMSDPGDLIGLLHKDEATGRSIFLPPYWWPVEGTSIVLFLDELNRARPEILQAVYDLALNRTLAGKRLPAGSVVISAVNEGEEYQLTDLDPALVSRFNLYEFAPTTEDWLLWASTHDVDQRVITFLQKNPQWLDGESARPDEAMLTTGLIKTPDRRAWVKVAHFINAHKALEDIHLKILAGMVGTSAALAFKQSLASAAKITPEQLLLQFGRHQSKLKDLSLQEMIVLNEQLVLWLQSQKYKASDADKIRQNALAYLQYLRKTKSHETLAHFASMVDNPKFEHARNMLYEATELVMLLMEYIQGIQV